MQVFTFLDHLRLTTEVNFGHTQVPAVINYHFQFRPCGSNVSSEAPEAVRIAISARRDD